MKYKNIGDKYLLRVDRNEDLCEMIIEMCQKNDMCGYFQGIGACKQAIISTYNQEKNSFVDHKIEGMLEIVSMQGNIVKNSLGEFTFHIHSSFSFVDEKGHLSIVGGHLESAIINYTGEIVFVPISTGIHTKYNPELGIEIWDL